MIYFIEAILALSFFYDFIFFFMATSGQGESLLPCSAWDTRKCSVLAT